LRLEEGGEEAKGKRAERREACDRPRMLVFVASVVLATKFGGG